jgi:hypothetical protein
VEKDLVTVAILVGGVFGVLAGASAGWGVVWIGAPWVPRLRSDAFYNVPWRLARGFSARRVLALLPFWSGSFSLMGAAGLLTTPGTPEQDPYLTVGAVLVVLGMLAFAFPRPFLGRWLRESEDRQRLGQGSGLLIPPGGIPRPDPPMSRRDWLWVAGMLAAIAPLAIGLKFGVPWLTIAGIVPAAIAAAVVIGWMARLRQVSRELDRLRDAEERREPRAGK